MALKNKKIVIMIAGSFFIAGLIYAEAQGGGGSVERQNLETQEAEPKRAEQAPETQAQPRTQTKQISSDVLSPAVSIIPAEDFDPFIEQLVLYVGQTQIIPVNTPKIVRVGNPLVCDITDVSQKQVYLTAKSAGQTTFSWEDKYGSYSLLAKVLGEDLSPTKARIERVLSELGFDKQITLGVNEDEGKIFMAGNLKTEEDKQRLNLGLERLKDKIIDLVTVKEDKPLVEIEVQILDINETFTKTIGVDWPDSITIRHPAGGGVVTDGVWQRLFNFESFDRSNLSVVFNFAISESLARVLAHPRIVTLSGKEAVINSGGEYPVLEQQGGGLTINYKPYGVTLKIKPTVIDGDRIQTQIEAEVSSRDTGVTATASLAGTQTQTYSVTGFTNRKIQTELYMKDNDVLLMGGLIYRAETKTASRLPGLGKLPFFNQLFRSSTNSVDPGRELVIMVKPRIIRQKEEIIKEEAQEVTPKIIPLEKYRRVPTELKDYIYDLKARIFQNASYPTDAKPLGIEGIVKLKAHILRTGQLDNVVLETSSGSAMLDNAALSLVEGLAPYKPFPDTTDYEDIWIDIPLVYHK